MDSAEFQKFGKEIIQFIKEYSEDVEKYPVFPDVKPGFLEELIDENPPQNSESFETILKDFKNIIFPGLTHAHHPKFLAFFSTGRSYASILGELLTASLSSIVSSWPASPAGTELETIVLDWYGKALGLPNQFLRCSSKGGAVIQSSASECILMSMIAARSKTLSRLKGRSTLTESTFLPRLVAYCSKDAHSCVEKASKFSLIKLRKIDVDDKGRMKICHLRESIIEDKKSGLTPFYVLATVGTTGCAAFDDIFEIGRLCKYFTNISFHVDGAYGGNSFILPEMRYLSKGLEFADSFNANASKLLLVNVDMPVMWVRNLDELQNTMRFDPIYLQHDFSLTRDYRNYGISLSRRFRALKFWFVIRSYGVSGLQSHVRNLQRLVKMLEKLLREDTRFEVVNDVELTVVCFRIKGSDEINRQLLSLCNQSRRMYMIPATVNDKFSLRVALGFENTTDPHIREIWSDVKSFADTLLTNSQPLGGLSGYFKDIPASREFLNIFKS